MKIYNKKGFLLGLFWLAMGCAWLYCFVYRGMVFFDAFLCAAQFGLGITYITRSFSRNMSDADQDERTQLIIQKTRACAYSWAKGLCIALGIFFVMLYSHTKNDLHMGLFICCSLLLLGMVIIEGIIEIYYDRKF